MLIDEDGVVVNGRRKRCSVVASKAWRHAGGKSRRGSDIKRTLEREIALIGEEAFCIRATRVFQLPKTRAITRVTLDENRDRYPTRIIEASVSRYARKMKD